MSGELSQSRLRILGYVIRNIEGMQSVDADEKYMLDVAGLRGGSYGKQARQYDCGQQSGEKATKCH
ncbi:MAG TPA: hypothetical protein VGD54_17670 [Steroidobacteraceae bacterium]